MDKRRFIRLHRAGYGEEGLALELGISVHFARKWIKRFGLKRHPFSRSGQKCRRDTRDKISAAHSGKILSREHREAISHGLVGKMSRENNPGWRGGEHRRSDGYVCIRMPGHHRAYSNGYVKRCVIVIEAKIGKRIAEHEVVHHKDGVRDNDSPENLEVMTMREHNSLTAKERWAHGDWAKRRRKS